VKDWGKFFTSIVSLLGLTYFKLTWNIAKPKICN